MLNVFVALIALSIPTLAAGQSLADLARREEARRSAITAISPVFTNADLRRLSLPESLAVESAITASSAGRTSLDQLPLDRETAAPPEGFDDRDKQYWAGRREVLAERLRQARIDVSALRLNLAAPANGNANVIAEKVLVRTVLTRAEADLRALEDEQLGLANDAARSAQTAKKPR